MERMRRGREQRGWRRTRGTNKERRVVRSPRLKKRKKRRRRREEERKLREMRSLLRKMKRRINRTEKKTQEKMKSCQTQLKKDTDQRCVGQRLNASPTQEMSVRAVVLLCHFWNLDCPQEEEGEEEGADEDEEQPESTERKEHDTDGQTGEQSVQSDTAVELAGEASERDQAKEVVYTQHTLASDRQVQGADGRHMDTIPLPLRVVLR